MTRIASTDGEIAELAGQLLFRLWRTSHTHTAEALEPLGLTPALFALLNVLGARKGAMQQAIGAEMGIDRSTMVVLIDELEAKRLAKRRPHPTDRRAREVTITAKGRQTLQRAREITRQLEAEVLRALTVDERDELLALLRRALTMAPPQSPWRGEEGD
jgi:MarR family transcriptional regulator, transcriptional regulator for hemolysin